MPTRSFYFPPDFDHIERIILDSYGAAAQEHILHFAKLKLPPLIDGRSLSLILGVSDRLITAISLRIYKHYRQFPLQKSDGSERQINAPRTYLKVIQWWILDNILSKISYPEFIFGFVRGKSPVENARYHRAMRHMLNIDISDFFPSIRYPQVVHAFTALGYSDAVSNQLARLCTLNGTLPQGAPTSPAIANLVFRDVDSAIARVADRQRLRYSRYADDLTFSGMEFISRDFLDEIEGIIKINGFKLNMRKTRFSSAGGRMEVTGYTTNVITQPSREWRKRVRAELHQLSKKEALSDKDRKRISGLKGNLLSCDHGDNVVRLIRSINNIV